MKPLIVFMLMLSLSVFGCKSKPTDIHLPDVQQYNQLIDQSGTVTESIRDEAKEITTIAEKGTKTEPNLTQGFWSPILISSTKIVGHTETMDSILETLSEYETVMENLKDENSRLLTVIAEHEAGFKKLEQWLWYGILWAGGLTAVAAIPCFFVSPRTSLFLATTGLATIGLGKFLIAWSWALGMLAGGVVLIGIGLLGWTIWEQRKEMMELVRSFDVLKTQKEWNEDTKGLIRKIQSPETQKTVNELRAKDKI